MRVFYLILKYHVEYEKNITENLPTIFRKQTLFRLNIFITYFNPWPLNGFVGVQYYQFILEFYPWVTVLPYIG